MGLRSCFSCRWQVYGEAGPGQEQLEGAWVAYAWQGPAAYQCQRRLYFSGGQVSCRPRKATKAEPRTDDARKLPPSPLNTCCCSCIVCQRTAETVAAPLKTNWRSLQIGRKLLGLRAERGRIVWMHSPHSICKSKSKAGMAEAVLPKYNLLFRLQLSTNHLGLPA